MSASDMNHPHEAIMTIKATMIRLYGADDPWAELMVWLKECQATAGGDERDFIAGTAFRLMTVRLPVGRPAPECAAPSTMSVADVAHVRDTVRRSQRQAEQKVIECLRGDSDQ